MKKNPYPNLINYTPAVAGTSAVVVLIIAGLKWALVAAGTAVVGVLVLGRARRRYPLDAERK